MTGNEVVENQSDHIQFFGLCEHQKSVPLKKRDWITTELLRESASATIQYHVSYLIILGFYKVQKTDYEFCN